MADAMRAAFSFVRCRPICLLQEPFVMAFEILLIAQMIRRPVQAIARRWYCRSLFRASRGRLHCAECTGA
jgi:hypothetical protein